MLKTNKTIKMTAQQARQQTEETILTNTDGEYQSTLKKIEQEVKKGNFFVQLKAPVSKTTREKLEKEGFVYNCGPGAIGRGDYITIRW